MNILRFVLSKKVMKICSKLHHLIKKFWRSMAPNPPSFAPCNSPSLQKVGPPMANPTYTHAFDEKEIFT